MMKLYQYFRIFSLSLLLFLGSSVVKGQLLNEDFDYGGSAGDLTTVGSANWSAHSGATGTKAGYVATSLSMTGYAASGVGGAATISTSGAEDVNTAFTEQTTGIVYYSTLINLTAVGSGNYFFHVMNGTSSFTGRVGAKTDGAAGVLFGIGSSSSTLTYGTTSFSLNTTYLLVASYNIDTGEANLHVLTSAETTEPGSPEATNTGNTGTSISTVAFRQSSNIPTGTVDGVRVATSWSDLIPTLCTAPSTQASAMNFTSIGDNGMTVNWTTGDGDDGVIVLAKAGSAVDTDPISGATYTADAAFSSGDEIGTGNYVVYLGGSAGAENVLVTGLTQGTTYHYTVYELNSTDVCYLAPGLAGSQATTSSVDSDSDITDPTVQITAGTISSLVDTEGEAVDVFTFKVTDAGTSDGLATIINAVVVEKGTNNNVADWSTIIAGAKLNDGTSDLTATTVTINADNITFDYTGNEYSIADNSSEELTLSIYLNTSVSDDEILEFEIPTSHSVSDDANGSGLITTLAGAITSNQFTVDVTATTFDVISASTDIVNIDFSIDVSAVDANGNVDAAARDISLSLGSGAGNLSSITGLTAQSMTSGSYSWTDVQHDLAEDITLTVDDDGSALTVTSSSITVSGSLFFEENFDYIDASTINGQGGWNKYSGTADQILVESPGLNYAYHPNSGIGNAVKIEEGGSEDIAAGAIPINSGSVYVSALVNVSGTTTPDTNGEYFMHANTETGFNYSNRIYVKDDGAGNLKFGITKVSGSVEYLTENFNYDETYLIAFKYTFNTGTSDDDVMDFWVNPSMNGIEPTPDLTHSATQADIAELTRISLRQSGGTGDVLVDGIRMATTWEALLPDFCSEPTVQASSVNFGATGNTSMVVNWTAGNGDKSLVVVKASTAVDATLTSGVDYTAATSVFSDAAMDLGGGNIAVYANDNTTQSVTVTGLTQGTTYHVAVYDYNAVDFCYNTTTPTVANNTTTTPNDTDSDISANGGTTSSIDYAAFQEAASLTTTNSASLFTFSINDNATTDAASTTLTDISFDITNHANIRTLAIFEGANTTSTVEMDVAGNISTSTLSFSSLILSAASGTSNDITVRATFLGTVTDDDQIQLTISGASADAAGSVFDAPDAGGVASDISTADLNAIAVTATVFEIDVPASVSTATDFTLSAKAVDANNNTDLGARNVTLSRQGGTGSLTSTLGLGPVAMTNGIYTWTDVQHDTEEVITVQVTDGSVLTIFGDVNVVTATAGVFFSEYSEGSSNNKYVEIYNGTGSSIDLSNYSVKASNNGVGFDNHPDFPAAYSVSLSGTLAAEDVYVIYNGSASTAISTEGDLALSYGDNPGDRVAAFNGDDGIGLFENGILIDLIGDPAVDPGSGWDVAGTATGTANHTLVRKSSITGGNTVALASFGTDVASSEWTVSAQDDVTNIGFHTVDGVASPSMVVTATLTDFGSVDNGAVSTSQSFTVSGTDLTADITVTGPSNYGVSLDNVTFTSSIVLPLVVDAVATTTVHVQFSPVSGSNGVKSGDITISTTGAGNESISITGTETGNITPTTGVFITELADPNNDAGLRYIELYNSTDVAVDFTEGTGWRIDKYTNESVAVSQTLALTGSIPSKGFYIIATGAADADFETAYGIAPDQFDGADNNVAGSNGDDNLELYNGSNVLIDQFGVPGEDGTNTNHEFENGRAERKATVSAGNQVWDVNEWSIDNDGSTFPGNGTRDAPDDFDVASWIGTGGPLISLDVSLFSGDFGGVESETLSSSSSFTVTGSDLTEDILVTAPANFYVALDDVSFSPSVTLTQNSGVVGITTIYVQFVPTAVQAYAGNIVLTSAGASDKPVVVSGTGLSSDVIFYEDFSGCDIANYNTISVSGDQIWSCTPSGQTGDGARMSGFDSNAFAAAENEDWLITPAIDLSSVTNATLTFVSDLRYDATPLLEVLASSDYSGSGDPTSFTWTALSGLLDQDADNFDTWTVSGDLDLSSFVGSSVFIAFKYTSTSSLAPTWSIDDILIEDRVSTASPSFVVTASITDFGSLDNGSTSTSQNFMVEGTDLTADITVTAPANFELSLDNSAFSASVALSPASGALASTTVHVRFAPTSGTNSALSGDITLSTTSANDQTIAVTGTETGNTEISNDLFFSEYLEGSSNNRAFEIFNGTGASVDLSSYSVKQSHNGVGFGNDDVANAYDLALSGTLEDGDVYVIYNVDATDPTIIAEGDLALTYGDTDGSRLAAFTGDDALGLFKNGTLIDVIGDPSNDPGSAWPVAGITDGSVDHTLVRKETITTGNITPLGSFGSSEGDSEWVVLDLDDVTSIGSHTGSDDPVDPGFTLTTTDFNGDFGSVSAGEVSTASSYNVSGTSITGDFTITIPAGFEASLTSDFSNKVGNSSLPLSITPDNGVIDNVAVYVRFIPDAAASFSGNLVNSATGYTDVNLALTGSGTVLLGLEVEGILKYNIEVYPNPTNNLLSIDIPQSFGSGYVNLVNLQGATVKTGRIGAISSFDVSDLRSGIYLLQITNQEAVISHRVIIK